MEKNNNSTKISLLAITCLLICNCILSAMNHSKLENIQKSIGPPDIVIDGKFPEEGVTLAPGQTMKMRIAVPEEALEFMQQPEVEVEAKEKEHGT